MAVSCHDQRQNEGTPAAHIRGVGVPSARTQAVRSLRRATGLKVFGQGEWAAWKHGARSTGPGWRTLHVGVDEEGFIVAASLTDAHSADASQVPGLLAQLGVPLASFTADGAYDGRPIYEAVLAAGSSPPSVVPPPRRAVVAGPSEPLLVQRDAAISAIQRGGRRAWKKAAGYHQQARTECAFSRYRRAFGPGLRARNCEGQNLDVTVAYQLLRQNVSPRKTRVSRGA